jgi:SHS2 domain-containing protein
MPGGSNYYQMIPFEYLEHTADVKFRAYGKTPEEMLSNAAAALFKSMVDPATITVKETWKVELEAFDLEDLAYQWLSEIVFLFETESAVFATFSIKIEQDRTEPWKLQAEIGGERIDLKRHAFENEVKAITRHKFGIKKNDVWCIQVILDV